MLSCFLGHNKVSLTGLPMGLLDGLIELFYFRGRNGFVELDS